VGKEEKADKVKEEILIKKTKKIKIGEIKIEVQQERMRRVTEGELMMVKRAVR
jgi:hypothetical protein